MNSSGYVPRDYDIFSGLDVDKKSISATFTGHDGLKRSVKMPYNAEYLMNHVRNHYDGQKIIFAYEAGPTGFGLYDSLMEQGYKCLVVSAANIPRAPGQRVKTNRLDSQKISENLRGGQLKSIHIPSPSYRQLRHLVQMRDTFVSQQSATKCRIKSLLLYEGIPFPESHSSVEWTRTVIAELKELKCSEAVHFKLSRLIVSLEFFHQNILDTTRAIRAFCDHDKELQRNIRYVQSISGIGRATACQLLARIGDWRELQRLRVNQLGSFLGLVPRENSTGDDVNRGSITLSGDSRLRNKLIQCAWVGIRKDPELREFYDRMCTRHNKTCSARKAIVAVARKLTTRIFVVLTQQRNYIIRTPANSLTQRETVLPQGETRLAPETVTIM